jgi:3-dehydroquinate dehydratase-2
MRKLVIVNGPNNNFYGIRNKGQYGNQLYADLIEELVEYGKGLDFEVEAFQSNGEGEIIDFFQKTYYEAEEKGEKIPMVLNPGAFTHYSYAVMDALESVHTLVPAIEVHMSNIQGRSDFRHISVTARECIGQIAGMGKTSYKMAMRAFREMIDADEL